MPLLLLILLSVLAYANAWPDALVFDDKPLLANGRLALVPLESIARYFTESVWVASGVEAGLYRPMFLAWMTLESRVFGDWYAGYHLVSIGFHALATVLVYGLLRKLLDAWDGERDQWQWAAFLAAAVFAVHPVHAEAVNSIFNRSEIMASSLVIGGLSWFLIARAAHEWRAWLVLCLVYFLALLFRESAASMPGLAAALVFLVSKESLFQRVRQCLPVLIMLVPLGLYLYLRTLALSAEPVSTAAAVAGQAAVSVEGQAGMALKLANAGDAVFLWYEALKHLLWPHPLQLYYMPAREHFWLAAGLQAGLLALAGWQYFAQKKPGLLIGLAFFYLAILPSSRIVAESTARPDLADRFLYLPSVGLSIVIAFGLSWLLALSQSGRHRRLLRNAGLGMVIAFCMVLTPLTWARNAEWSDELTLYEADYAKMSNPRKLLYTMIGAHNANGNFKRSAELCRKHADRIERNSHVKLRCAAAYVGLSRYQAAEKLYREILSTPNYKKSATWAHYQLGSMYARTGRRGEANAEFDRAASLETLDYLREFIEASRLLMLYPNVPARRAQAVGHLERAIELQPRFMPAREALQSLGEN